MRGVRWLPHPTVRPPPGEQSPEQRPCRLPPNVGPPRVPAVEEELPGSQPHRERGREQGGGNRAHRRPSSPDDEETDRDERQQVKEEGLPLSPVERRERRDMIWEVQVVPGDGERARAGVVHGVAWGAHLPPVDLAPPPASPLPLPPPPP